MVATPRALANIRVGGEPCPDLGEWISVGGGRGGYEEYHPYGTTAWWAEASGIEVSEKRYRYTGMERDDETGLALHGVRLYTPWLGRWCSADPIGLGGGVNRFAYALDSPTMGVDQTGTSTWLAGLLAGCTSPDDTTQSPQPAPKPTTPPPPPENFRGLYGNNITVTYDEQANTVTYGLTLMEEQKGALDSADKAVIEGEAERYMRESQLAVETGNVVYDVVLDVEWVAPGTAGAAVFKLNDDPNLDFVAGSTRSVNSVAVATVDLDKYASNNTSRDELLGLLASHEIGHLLGYGAEDYTHASNTNAFASSRFRSLMGKGGFPAGVDPNTVNQVDLPDGTTVPVLQGKGGGKSLVEMMGAPYPVAAGTTPPPNAKVFSVDPSTPGSDEYHVGTRFQPWHLIGLTTMRGPKYGVPRWQ